MMEEKGEDIFYKLIREFRLKMSKEEKEEETRDILMSHYDII